MIAQALPIDRNARTRRSSDSAWPLKDANGLTWADRKEQERSKQ